MCFSFIYTEKTVKVVKEYDDIMIELKKVEDSYKIEPVNAYILDKTIIPGLNGKKIDIDKSYSKMKRYGKFNESLITFVETAPDVSIKNNYDKFVISGNETKNQVSFIFLATKNTDLSKILSILKQKNTLANIFIDFNYYDANKLQNIVSYGHEIGNLSLNYDYNDSSFQWLNSKIKKVTKQTYCYDDSYNEETLLICSLSKIYTIKPSIITDSRPLYEIKKNVKNGSIIAFHVNETLEDELPLIINYLKSKDLDIVLLSKLLEE
jgi:hypothetical protein